MEKNYYNRIQELRWEHNMSQTQLAKLSGVNRSTIQAIENGLSVPSIIIATKLARAFYLPVEEVFVLRF